MSSIIFLRCVRMNSSLCDGQRKPVVVKPNQKTHGLFVLLLSCFNLSVDDAASARGRAARKRNEINAQLTVVVEPGRRRRNRHLVMLVRFIDRY